ncbi:MAG: hypothetical protein AAF696_35890 [Bacteroidota bacterium]
MEKSKMTYFERANYAFMIFGDGYHLDEEIATCAKEIFALVEEMAKRIYELEGEESLENLEKSLSLDIPQIFHTPDEVNHILNRKQ